MFLSVSLRFPAVLLLACLVMAQTARAYHEEEMPKYEVRAVWLTTIGGLDWPHNYSSSPASAQRQKEELRQILDRLQEANINTVLLQTRIRATTIYPSALEPWDGCFSGMPGKSPGYDPLAFAVEECHKRGMELHAWVVAIPVGKWGSEGCKSLRKKHPDMVKKIGDSGFMNPENPAVAPYIASLCREIAEGYDVDGIHLDYIRYPEEWPTGKKKGNIDLGEKARRNITEIVKQVYNSVKDLKPWIKISCSPVGKFDDLSRFSSRGWNAFRRVGQDAQGWLKDGIMDILFPMMYFRNDQFFPFALDWKENSYGRPICSGLGIYFLSPKEGRWQLTDIRRQLFFLRDEGLGHAFFRSKFLTDDTKGIYSLSAKIFDRYPALTPPISWQNASLPETPQSFEVERFEKGDIITWEMSSDTLYYNIYASHSFPVDTDDPKNLVGIKLRKNRISVELTEGQPTFYYALTAIDRYGNESPATQCQSPSSKESGSELFAALKEGGVPSSPVFSNDGKTLQLPHIQGLNAKFISFETLQGVSVASRTFDGGPIDISRIPDGFYQLRSHAKKGAPHRLGFIIIKRDQTN